MFQRKTLGAAIGLFTCLWPALTGASTTSIANIRECSRGQCAKTA